MKSIKGRNGIKSATFMIAALAMLMAYGCGDDDESGIVTGDARIRAIHLSADAPNVDIYVDETPPPGVTNLAFGESTTFIDIDPGTYTFNITVANGPPPPPSVLDVGPLTLEEGKAYTAVAFDVVTSIEALALVDDLSNPGAGNIRLRPIHAAPGVPQVDIWEVTDPLNPIALYPDVDFRDVGAYAVLPAGTYTLGFDVNNDANPDLTFSTGAIPAGSILNVFAVNDGAAVFLLAQFEDGTVAQIDPI